MTEVKSARLQTLEGVDMGLLGVKLSGSLRGAMFEAKVEQRFYNPSDRHVEVVYSFPLPWGAVLLGVDVQLGGRQLTGAVVKKAEAEAGYEEALSQGDAAILLEKNRDHSYSLSLGNLAAHEICVITLRYAQILAFSQGGFRLLIPTVIAPRYGDPLLGAGLRPHQAPEHSPLAEHPFELSLCLHGDIARARVTSPSHSVAFHPHPQAEEPMLKLSIANQAYLDRDFVLVMDDLPSTSEALAAPDSARTGRRALLASFCPRVDAKGPMHVAVKLLVDCSGSMAGDSMEAARRALQGIARGLQVGDRFSLSRFGNEVQHRSRGLWQLTEATQRAALRWSAELEADMGGTEMEAALRSTFELGLKAKASNAARDLASADVLLVTDGEINAIDSLLAAAVASGHRVFVVGIGSSPAETHLRRLAEATGGACDFVAPGETVEPAVLRMFARLRSPRISELHLVWPVESQVGWAAPLPSSVFDGDVVHVLAWTHGEVAGELRLVGRQPNQAELEVLGAARLIELTEREAVLPRMVASAQVQQLRSTATRQAEDGKRAAEVAETATQLALDYSLVTEWTNFLLTHERTSEQKAHDMPTLHKVAQMTPAGWGGTSTVRFSRSSPDTGFAPIACRKVGREAVHLSMASSDLDAPSFLRRSKPQIDLTHPRHWANTPHYSGLTPLGLSQWLLQTERSTWPQTLDELSDVGLGQWVIEWLELVIAQAGDSGSREAEVVQTFMHLMVSVEMRTTLSRSDGLAAVVKGAAQRLRKRFSSNEGHDMAISAPADSHVDPMLLKALDLALRGITARTWPDAVFELIEVDQDLAPAV